MSFTPKWYAGGWVEYAPNRFASCGLLDREACLAMAEEMAADPTLQPAQVEETAALSVEITEGTLLWGRVIFVAGMSLMLLALIVRG